jgi:hypothetical protein
VRTTDDQRNKIDLAGAAMGFRNRSEAIAFAIDFLFDSHFELIERWAYLADVELNIRPPEDNPHEPGRYFAKLESQVRDLRYESYLMDIEIDDSLEELSESARHDMNIKRLEAFLRDGERLLQELKETN